MEGDHTWKMKLWNGAKRKDWLKFLFLANLPTHAFFLKINGLLYFHTSGDCPDRLFRVLGGGGSHFLSSLLIFTSFVGWWTGFWGFWRFYIFAFGLDWVFFSLSKEWKNVKVCFGLFWEEYPSLDPFFCVAKIRLLEWKCELVNKLFMEKFQEGWCWQRSQTK